MIATVTLQVAFGLVFAWGALAPFARAGGWPPALVGFVFSATPLGYGPATIVGGRLADRLPPRVLLWLATGLMASGFAVAFVLPGAVSFVAAYSFVALGLGGGLALTGSLAAAVHAFPRHVGAAGGLLTAVYALAGLVEVPVLMALAPRLGWLGALRAVGGFLLLAVALSVIAVPRIPAPGRALERDRSPMPRLLGRPLLLTALAVEALATPLGTYAVVNVALYALHLGLPGSIAAAALLAVVAGNGAGRVAAGLLADRAGPDAVYWVVCAAGASGAGLLWWGAAAALPAGAALAGLAMGGGAGVLSRAAADAVPEAPHTAFGILFGGYALGAVLGPLAALVAEPRAAWALLGAGAVAAAGVLGLRRRIGAPKAATG